MYQVAAVHNRRTDLRVVADVTDLITYRADRVTLTRALTRPP